MVDTKVENKSFAHLMGDGKDDSYSLKEVFVYGKVCTMYLASKWLYIGLIGIVGAAIGLLAFTLQKPKYQAECTFILEEKQSGLGGLGGLASQFGFDLSGAGGGSLFAGDNILEILKSRKIIQNALLSRIDSSNQKKLIDLLMESNGWKEQWRNKEHLKDINYWNVNSRQPLTLQQDSVLGLAHKMLVKNNLVVERLIKKGSMIKVSVSFPNEIFAKLLVERIIDDAKSMYVQVKTNNSSTNVGRLEKKSDSLLRLLNVKSYQTAGSVVIDANPALRTAAVPTEINQRDKVVLQTLYAEVVKNLEVSRIALMQQTPVIEILDAPTYPLVDKRKGLAFFIVVFFGIGVLLSSGFFLFKFFMK